MGELGTTHRSCRFYLTWFFKVYGKSDHGWQVVRTPDNQSIMQQDSFFWLALEAIARKLNEMIVHEQWKASQGK